MKKRLLITIVAIALVLSTAIGLTLAYLTDRDSDVNVMTVGKVTVAMDIQERGANGLQDFTQEKELRPFVAQTNADDETGLAAKDAYGMPSTETAMNFIDKIVTVENTGRNNAYIRVLVAVPAAVDSVVHIVDGNGVDVDADDNDVDPAYGWTKTTAANMTINGIDHVVYVYTSSVIAPDQEMAPVIAGIYLDSKVDFDDETKTWITRGTTDYNYDAPVAINWDFDNGVEIPVYTQAVQVDGFLNAADAFTTAFGDTVANNVTTIVNPWIKTAFVKTEAELNAALNNANVATVVLTKDIELTNAIEISRSVIIDGNGFAITADSAKTITLTGADKNVVIKQATFTNVTVAATATFNGTIALEECTTPASFITKATGCTAEVYVDGVLQA